jgi:hypothetical protein
MKERTSTKNPIFFISSVIPKLLVTDGTSFQVHSFDDATPFVWSLPNPLPAELVQATFGYFHNRSTPIVCGHTNQSAIECNCYSIVKSGNWNHTSTVYRCPENIPSASISLSGKNSEIIIVGGNQTYTVSGSRLM